MNPWNADDVSPHQLRRLGKTQEELGELMAVIGRIQIQGLDAIDPSTGKTNRQRYLEEHADAVVQLSCNAVVFIRDSDSRFVADRIARKLGEMYEWEAHYK